MRFYINTSIIVLNILLQSTVVNAQVIREHHCNRNGITRRVELQVDNKSGAPCHVLYYKPMEALSTTIPWNASYDAQFCSNKYELFIVNLETQSNWSCKLIKGPDLSLTEYDLPPDSSTVTSDKRDLGMDQNASREAAAVTNDVVVENAGSALSMKQIEYYIPSGMYVSYKEKSRSDNSPLCPADGYFNWSAKSPFKPVFEMGADHVFQFDLTSPSELPVGSGSRGGVFQQCQPKISAGYCSNEKYFGDAPLHPVLSSYFGCDDSSASSQNQRPLVLVRTLLDSNPSASECNISENYQHLALAPSPLSSGSAETTEKHGIELVIIPKRTHSNSMNLIKGYVCRYVRAG